MTKSAYFGKNRTLSVFFFLRLPLGGKDKTCKEKDIKHVHLGDHRRTLWQYINFDPQTFEITELQYDDLESLDSSAGDRKFLDTVHFPRQHVDRSTRNESEKEKFNIIRIRNFPLDLSDEEIVNS